MKLVRRFPFTLFMGISLLLIGVMSATVWGTIDSTTMKLFGLSPDHVYSFNLYRLLTSVFLTHGGIIFWRSWTMLCLCLLWCEYESGTKTTLATFWIGHFATIMIVSWVVVPLLLLARPESGDLVLLASDVGPSAGYIACLTMGCLSIRIPRLRGIALGAVACALIALLLMRTHLLHTKPAFWLADVSHLVSFLLTFGIAIAFKHPRRPHRVVSSR